MPIDEFFLEKLRSNAPDLVEINNPGRDDPLTAADIKQLVEAAENNTNLKILLLDENNIGDEGCKYLSKLKNIETLALGSNNITNSGAILLSKIPNLENLSLSDNNIDDDGFAKLLNISNIKSLAVNDNPITDKGASLALENTTLTDLFLENGGISKGLIARINEKLGIRVGSFIQKEDSEIDLNMKEIDRSAQQFNGWGDLPTTSEFWGSDDTVNSNTKHNFSMWQTAATGQDKTELSSDNSISEGDKQDRFFIKNK